MSVTGLQRREGNKSDRTNTLKQAKTKAMGGGGWGTFSIVFLCSVSFYHQEIKTQNSLFILEKMLILKSLWGLLIDIDRYLLQDSKHIFKYLTWGRKRQDAPK